jgi:hypothetical protein
MPCPDFEELVREGRAGHAAQCAECRDLLEALEAVNAAFDAAFRGVAAPPAVAAGARARIARESCLRRPSPVPEILDFIGWAATLTAAALLLPRFLPQLEELLARLG